MKKLFFALLIPFAFSVKASAVDLNYIRWGNPESTYVDSVSTISISSFAVTTIAATTGWRQIIIPNVLTGATSFYYRIDGSTQNIPTAGMPIIATQREVIETNAAISFEEGPAQTATTVRVLERRK